MSFYELFVQRPRVEKGAEQKATSRKTNRNRSAKKIDIGQSFFELFQQAHYWRAQLEEVFDKRYNKHYNRS